MAPRNGVTRSALTHPARSKRLARRERGIVKIGKPALLMAVALCGIAGLGPALAAGLAGQAAATPNFGPNSETAWIPARPAGDDFIPPESGPGPVMSEKGHPYIP